MAAIHPVWGSNVHIEENNPVDTNDTLVVSQSQRASISRELRSVPSKRAVLSHGTMVREKKSPGHVFDLRRIHVSPKSSL